MKKTLVTMLAAAAMVASSYGQGTVTFNNTATTLVTKDTAPGDSTQVGVVGNPSAGKVELLWAPVGTTDLSLFAPLGAVVNVAPTPGRFNGGTRSVPAGSGFTGIAAGGAAAFVVRGWTGAAASWATVAPTEAVGYSAIFTLNATGNPMTTPAGTPVAITSVGGFAGLQLHYVPEPTSMALAGLGAASLLIFRRRK
jgi:hypothetical protein